MDDTIPLPPRITRRIIPNPQTGCWEWTGAQRKGYGQVGWQRRVVVVHRLVWQTLRGPIPEGLVMDHLCRNRCCCNPDHLRVVTGYENVMDGRSQNFGAINSRKTHCPSGHAYDPGNLVQSDAARGIRRCLTCRRAQKRDQHRRRRAAARKTWQTPAASTVERFGGLVLG